MQKGIDIQAIQRKSHIEIGEVYFWTATIHKWQKLLLADDYKDVVIASLKYLSEQEKIEVYAFVIMPNHVHLIWKIKKMNGKEMPQSSFLKYTAQQFRKKLLEQDKLDMYKVDAANKEHEFWQRDSLAIPLYKREVAFQKLKYIHNNPLAEHWQLAKEPCEYRYSSAKYYESDKKNFDFLKDLWEIF